MKEERRRSLNRTTMHSNFKKDFTANTSGFLHDPVFTKLKKLTPIILFIALLLFFISYGSPYWAESTSETTRPEHIGLWRFCSEGVTGQENCDDFINLNYNDWLKSAQSFMTLAMFGFFITVPAYLAYIFVGGSDGNKRVLFIALGSSGLTVGFLIIGMCSFAFRYDEYFWQHDSEVPVDASSLSWAFYLALVSCLLTIIAPVFVVLEIFADKYFMVDTEENDGL